MKKASTFLCLSCIGLAGISAAIQSPAKAQVLIQNDACREKALVENSLRHEILVSESLHQKNEHSRQDAPLQRAGRQYMGLPLVIRVW